MFDVITNSGHRRTSVPYILIRKYILRNTSSPLSYTQRNLAARDYYRRFGCSSWDACSVTKSSGYCMDFGSNQRAKKHPSYLSELSLCEPPDERRLAGPAVAQHHHRATHPARHLFLVRQGSRRRWGVVMYVTTAAAPTAHS